MDRRSRRTVLSAATGAVAVLAGCLGADLDDGSEENGDERDDGSGGDDSVGDEGDDDGSGGGDAADAVDETTFTTSEPRSEPNATLLADREAAAGWLAGRDVGDDAVAFLENTAFDDASLIAVEARAPNLCYELRIESIELEDGIALEAVVDDGDAAACAQQEATAGLLVRASDGGEPIEEGTATVVDHDGATHEFDLGADT
ncbi:hypothetical protein [Natronococcus jeotgali]|uniref:Lipoprotein n=1 Tax=Natronococcus jeotgali DSM 18795 TaxID=1227498 RepID=L9WYC3_9EURY|nr:hypothetical protein [Natronococcus jeotgali]ELY53363.1 hypothetical protein C492_17580 [Natronococcus jeotgali DSM 18795]